MDPLFISYYTPGPYEAESRLLKEAMNALGLEYHHRNVGPRDTWQNATQFKARFVRDMRQQNPGRPLVYLDVDCIVIRKPVLFWDLHQRCDVAACIFAGQELLSGTVYFGPRLAADRIIDAWIAENERYPVRLPNGQEAWDQRTLHRVIKADPSVRFEELPQSYTWMVGLTQRRYPDVDPVILHTRGSFRHNPSHV